MYYLIRNELDEIPRLVRAESQEEAITKAKASVTSESLQRRKDSELEHYNSLLEYALRLAKTSDLAKQYTENTSFEDIEALEVDDFVWEVTQVFPENLEIYNFEDLLYC